MKNVAYFFLLSIELTKDLVSCVKTETIPFTFKNNYVTATFYSVFFPCEETDLILEENDDRLFDVLDLELAVSEDCTDKHLWKITSPNTFKRFSKLIVLKIRGLILLPDDIEMREKLESQLFNVPTITHFQYENCFIKSTRGKSVRWVLPPNVSEVIIKDCDIAYFHWEKPTTLKVLNMIDPANYTMQKLPELGFPSLEGINILFAPKINFSIPEIAFFCNMTKFTFNYDEMRKENPCKCELLKQWQRHLETQKFTLIIDGFDDNFKNTACEAVACPNFDGPLKEAKSRRASCLSLKRPSPEDATPTVKKKEFDSSSWPFWIFVVGGFLIISLIFALFMFAAERLTRTSEPALTTPTESIGEEELEEAIEEAEKEEE